MPDPKPLFLLDTGPLISLCAFPTQGRRAHIQTVLNYADLAISAGVAREALHEPPHPDVKIFKPLLESGQLTAKPVPTQPEMLDIAYAEKLGVGERDIIRVGLGILEAFTVIDDKDAFQIANRFGLRPMVFQDMLVLLAREFGLPKLTAVEIVQNTASRYPASFLVHTLFLLNEVT